MAKWFSVNSRAKFLCPYQVSWQGSTWNIVFLSKFLDSFQSFRLLFWWIIHYSAFWANVNWILNKYFWLLLEFGPTIFIYHGKTFMVRHVFFFFLFLLMQLVCSWLGGSYSRSPFLDHPPPPLFLRLLQDALTFIGLSGKQKY